jgi:ribokinase
MRVGVVGHVEWTRLARAERAPGRGEIVHGAVVWEGPAGSGSVAAVQLAKLADSCTFFTALGDDVLGERAAAALRELGVEVRAATRRGATREAVGLIDDAGERTLTTLGDRLAPTASDPLGWEDLEGFDAVYFTAGDAKALRLARAAAVLVATAREARAVARAGVALDALVGSIRDRAETYDSALFERPPGLVVLTDGALGGTYSIRGGEQAAYRPVDPPGPILDTYGTGDTFAGALTFAVGSRLATEEALALAARCASAALTGRGPFAGQLSGADLHHCAENRRGVARIAQTKLFILRRGIDAASTNN